MRSWALRFLCVLVLGGSSPCLAQQSAQKAAAPADSETAPKRPAGTVTRPKDGVQHPDLDKAWADYDAAVAKATESIKAAIAKQLDVATTKGDLDAVEKWEAIAKEFEKAGRLPAEGTLKPAGVPSSTPFTKAKEELARDYESIVKALTMDKQIDEAKAVRNEHKDLFSDARTRNGGSAATGSSRAITPPRLRNTIGVELILLPAGSFKMGSEDGGANEKPTHEVRLTEAFYMAKTEVTNAQWRAVMGGVPSKWQDNDRPVEQVSWEHATLFCAKLSEQKEERAAGRVYRLPTEAEWEYACRAGTATRYSFGNDDAQLPDYGWFNQNSGQQTQPVGQKKPNPWGLYDMHGNLWELVADWYGEYPKGAVTNPSGPSTGTSRIIRGGRWSHGGRDCSSSRREPFGPADTNINVGFRVALSVPK